MTKPAVTIDGDERLAATCHDAADELADMDTASRISGELVRARAVGKAPKVSGRLAGSIRVDTEPTGVAIASDLVYAPVINSGWPAHNIMANPFLTSALTDATGMIVDRYEAETNNAIQKVRGA